MYPNPMAGTRGVTTAIDATGGVLAAVVETTPSSVRGYHPFGNSDASGFAAMGVTELILHTFDILSAHGVAFHPEDEIVSKVLSRIFPNADHSAEPWGELLRLTGRTAETRGSRWRWDSSV